MTLVQRIMLSISALVVLVCAGISVGVKRSWEARERDRYDSEFRQLTERVRAGLVEATSELPRQLIPLCEHGQMVDSTLVALQQGGLSHDRKYALSQLVPASQKAFGFDELIFFTGSGEILGAHDPSLIGRRDPSLVDGAVTTTHAKYADAPPRLIAECTKAAANRSSARVQVGLRASRHLDSILKQLAEGSGLALHLGAKSGAASWSATIELEELPGVTLQAIPTTDHMSEAIAELNRQIVTWGLVTLALGLSLGYWLARRLGDPLRELAVQARRVASLDPMPIRARGGRELEELASAFNQTLDDLARLRAQLAASERIAAQREIAHRVAHEIKNPLAPIRAAMETLRRLRRREDPAFDEYFEEATHTVLTEVERITSIIREFTQFARLPEPQLQLVALPPLIERVLNLHRSTSPYIEGRCAAPEHVRVDPDQLVQVLTNLLQNSLDAVAGTPQPTVIVSTLEQATTWTLTVEDNGPGLSAEVRQQLFVPYFTTKPGGTGLGLAMVQHIVTTHDGWLKVDASPLGGACFRATFPHTRVKAASHDVRSLT